MMKKRTDAITQKMKDWNLLKTSEEYDFYERMIFLSHEDKTTEFQQDYLNDLNRLTGLLNKKDEKRARSYIMAIPDKKRKIIAAHEYFKMSLNPSRYEEEMPKWK